MSATPLNGNPGHAHGHPPSDGFDALDETHRRMLDIVDDLARLAASIDDHGDGAAVRAQAAAIAEFFAATVRQHHADEEKHVFPPLLATGDDEVVQAVLRLQQDHGWLEEDWLELEPHLQALAAGFGVCDVELLRAGVEVFVALLRDHIALEEALIYPQARARLGDVARKAMGREMAHRRREQRKAAARRG